MKTKIFTLLFAIVASIGTICAKVKIGDLYYNFDDATMTASVTNALRFNGSTEYLTKSIIEFTVAVKVLAAVILGIELIYRFLLLIDFLIRQSYLRNLFPVTAEGKDQ